MQSNVRIASLLVIVFPVEEYLPACTGCKIIWMQRPKQQSSLVLQLQRTGPSARSVDHRNSTWAQWIWWRHQEHFWLHGTSVNLNKSVNSPASHLLDTSAAWNYCAQTKNLMTVQRLSSQRCSPVSERFLKWNFHKTCVPSCIRKKKRIQYHNENYINSTQTVPVKSHKIFSRSWSHKAGRTLIVHAERSLSADARATLKLPKYEDVLFFTFLHVCLVWFLVLTARNWAAWKVSLKIYWYTYSFCGPI